MPALFENSKKKFPGHEEISQTTTGWNLSVDMPNQRKRRDLSRLYGMKPVSEEMYSAIMRAENGRATEGEHRILEQHIKEKTAEIRERKREMGLEGGGRNRTPGRLAESALLDLMGLVHDNKEDEDSDEH